MKNKNKILGILLIIIGFLFIVTAPSYMYAIEGFSAITITTNNIIIGILFILVAIIKLLEKTG